MGGRDRREGGPEDADAGDGVADSADADADSPDDRERVRRLRRTVRERYGEDTRAVVAGLDSDDPEERAGAAWELAELAADDPDRLPVKSKLPALLADDDEWVRRGASWALAVVAESNPHRARSAVGAMTDALSDEDRLVRENGILALAGVASEYPLAAEPALSHLAELTREEDGLVRRYAAETLRDLVRRLDEDGFPQTIAAGPGLADVLPGDASVVEVTDVLDDEGSVQVGRPKLGGRADDERGADDEDDEAVGPPDLIPSPPTIDADFRSFERVADLGTGPLTTAAKARARADGGQQVVVTLRMARTDGVEPDAVERAFLAWAGVADHDHVVPVLARGRSPRPWIATEFMDGGSLRDSVGTVEFERALWYAHCVTKAVCYAHARGVVHGALRPGVVGLSRTLGAWPVPKVGDWGFGDALAAGTSGGFSRLPTPFAAPEHLAPEEFGRLDHATDVYQLGVICYAMFAGRLPFVGEGDAVARAVRERDPPPASSFAPSLPDAVDDLLARALTKAKTARFETAEDFRRELDALLEAYGPETF